MEGEQQYREQFGSPLEQAYGHLKNILAKHEQHLSEKYLAPIREHLDRMGDDLQTAAETGHTQTQGRLSYPARLMAGGVGALLKQVPVGRNVSETVQMSVTPPELGPEGRALSKELKAGKAVEKTAPNLEWTSNLPVGEFPGKEPGSRVSKTQQVPIEQIEATEKTDPAQVAKLKNQLQADASKVPPIVAEFSHDGPNDEDILHVVDGHHRLEAAKQLGMQEVPVKVHVAPDDWAKVKAAGGMEVRRPAAQAPNLENVRHRAPLPPQPRLPDTGTHAAIKTDDGSIYFDDAPEKQRTHITLAKDLGIPPERVVSGGWLQDGHYEASERSDAGRWGEQARAKAAVAEKRAARAQSSELPAPTTPTPEAKARERAANLKGLGIGLTEMDPSDAKNWVGYTGQKSIKVYRGVDDPAHTIQPGDFVTTSKESASNYGKHLQEIEVSPEELRYVRGHKDGDPKLLDQGGQTELIYAPKATTPKQAPISDDQILDHFGKKYPAAKETVDGRTVREDVPNLDSISASLAPNYEVLDGVREIPMSHFDDPGSITPRTKQLASDIKQSGQINPLIVAIDHRGPYILEGGHRFDALRINKAKSFPAVVALDLNKGFRPNVEEEELAAGQTETLYHGSPDVSKIDQLKPGSKGGYFGDGIYLTRDPNVTRRFTKLEAMNPTLERNADGSFTDINTGKRIPGGKPGVLETTLKDARLKKITMDEMDAEIEKFRKPNGVIDLDGARNAIAQRFAKQGYDGFDVSASKYFDEPQVVIFPGSAHKLSVNKPEAKSPYTIQGAQPEQPWNIHDLGKDHNIPSDDGYLYHATNHDRAHEIAASGLDVHKPSYGTDQQTWPDGATEKRSYFTKQADHAWQFAPEKGNSALLRMKQDPTIHNRESTGDFYSKKKIPANRLEVLGDDKQWHPITELASNNSPEEEQRGMIAYRNGRRIDVEPPKKLK